MSLTLSVKVFRLETLKCVLKSVLNIFKKSPADQPSRTA